jgi:hypothetical protein
MPRRRLLIAGCLPPRLDAALAYDLRLRARLVRRDERATLDGLTSFESALRARGRAVIARHDEMCSSSR